MKQLLLSFGSVTIYLYGVLVALGGVLGYFIARKRVKKFNLSEELIDGLFLILIPSAVIGARIYHILDWFSYYRLFPKEIFYLWQGGLGIYGAIIAGVIGVFTFSKIKKIHFLSILDLLAPSILIAQAIGRIGNLFNLEAFGPPTNLPWKIYVPPDKRPINFLDQSYFHPTFFYEAVLCFLAILIILYFEHRFKPKKGFSFGFYLFAYGLIRFFTEFLRFDTWVVFGVKMAQILSFVFVLLGIHLMRRGLRSK